MTYPLKWLSISFIINIIEEHLFPGSYITEQVILHLTGIQANAKSSVYPNDVSSVIFIVCLHKYLKHSVQRAGGHFCCFPERKGKITLIVFLKMLINWVVKTEKSAMSEKV